MTTDKTPSATLGAMTDEQKQKAAAPKRMGKNLLPLFKAMQAIDPIGAKIEKVIDSKTCIVSLVFPPTHEERAEQRRREKAKKDMAEESRKRPMLGIELDS